MNNLFAHIGMGTVVQKARVLFITKPGVTTANRYVENAKKAHKYHSAAHGKKFRSVIVLDDGTVIISCISPMTLMRRMNDVESVTAEDQAEEEAEAAEEAAEESEEDPA